jgi:hypothetical protein
MKKSLLALFIGLVALVVCNTVYSQATYTWNLAGGGSWATANNWTPSRTAPASNDILRFTNGGTKIITNVPTQTIGKLQITANSNITLQATNAGTPTLTVSTAASDAIEVDAGSTLQIQGVRQSGNNYGLTLTTANTVGLQANIDGTVIVTYWDDMWPATLGVFTKGGANATINFNNGSKYTHDVNASLIPVATWNTNSTCYVTGLTNTAPSNLNQSFADFTYESPDHAQIVNFNSALTTITGDFTVKHAGYVQGQRSTFNGLALSSNTSFTLNIGGDLIIDHANDEASWLMLTTGSANVTVNIGGDFLISNTGSGFVYFDYYVGTALNSLVMNIMGNFNQTGGYFDWTFYPSATGSNYTVMNLYGNFSQTGNSVMVTSTTDAGTPNGKIYFRKAGTQTIYASTPANVAYTNFDVQSGSTVEMLSNLYLYSDNNVPWGGRFIVNSGGSLDMNTYQLLSSAVSGLNNEFNLNSGGNVITANVNGLQNTTIGSVSTSIATRTYSSGANYTYDGIALQNSGTFTTTPIANQVNNLTINNTAGINTTGVTLQQEFKVAGVCTFINGVFTTTNTNLLTLNDNASYTGIDLDAVSTNMYVNGPMKKIGNDPFAFPVGKISHGCRPIYISAPSNTTDEFRAELIRGDAGLLGPITATGLDRVSGCEYWYLDRLAGTSNVNVSLSWNGESPCNAQSYVTDLPNLVVAHFNGTSWDAYGTDGGTTGNAVKGTVTWNYTGPYNTVPVSTPWSLGSLVWWSNPLTVKFINLQASEKNGQVKVEWANIAETGVDKYFIEYSTDGRSFSEINNTSARKNNGERTDYLWWHTTPANTTIYYRMKAVEFTGDVTYSHIVRLDLTKNYSDVTVFPNPIKDNKITVAASNLAEARYEIMILNMSGQKIMQRSINHAGGSITMQIDLPESIKAGMYSIRLSGGEKTFIKTFLVQ